MPNELCLKLLSMHTLQLVSRDSASAGSKEPENMVAPLSGHDRTECLKEDIDLFGQPVSAQACISYLGT